jgi:hypothetical protein
MRIPVWLTLGVAILVILFGVHRLRLSFRTDDEEQRARRRKGLYAMGRRTHRLIGVVYLLLGAALVATTFGWNPFGDLFGPSAEAPPADKAPASTKLPIDNLPPPPKK